MPDPKSSVKADVRIAATRAKNVAGVHAKALGRGQMHEWGHLREARDNEMIGVALWEEP